jgi:hypothetical protein
LRETGRHSEEPSVRSPRGNRNVYVVLVCFLIAAVFWLLLALSGSYISTIALPVEYTNFPSRKVIVNELPDSVTVRVKASGFKIISLGFQKDVKPVTIDVAQGLANTGSLSDALAIPTRYFLQDFTRSLGNDVEVAGFAPDSIILLFKDKVSKKVPVRMDVTYTLEKQFDTVGAPHTIPDSVLVSGPPSHLSRISYVRTEPFSVSGLKSSVMKPLKLVLPSMITANPEIVKLDLPVEEFTEGEVEVLVRIMDIPSGYSIKTYPEKVKLRYQVPLSRFKEIDQQQFDIVADATGLPSSAVTVLPLRLVQHPANVRSFIMEPSEVEFILRKK